LFDILGLQVLFNIALLKMEELSCLSVAQDLPLFVTCENS
jgi:hypothetical protein